jgi:hypothetical protein
MSLSSKKTASAVIMSQNPTTSSHDAPSKNNASICWMLLCRKIQTSHSNVLFFQTQPPANSLYLKKPRYTLPVPPSPKPSKNYSCLVCKFLKEYSQCPAHKTTTPRKPYAKSLNLHLVCSPSQRSGKNT